MSEITCETSSLKQQGAHATIPVGVEPVRLWFNKKFCRGLLVRAAKTNTVTVYLGAAESVTADLTETGGMPVDPGEFVSLPVDSPADVFAVATANGQHLHWIGV